VSGGLTPIAGSSVTLYVAGTTGYGSGATAIGTATTNASGTFTVLSYTCPAGNPETYITATGGNAGSGANSAIVLMAALGPCNSLTPSTSVTINELTTAAAQWALAQFFDSGGHNIGTSSTNAIGLQNAYAGVANLADVNVSNFSVSGNPSGFLPSAAACASGSPPVNCDGLQRLNTLANILAGCIESSGASSSACAALMCDATPGLTYSGSCSGTPTITDTLGAAHLIVTNPASNVSALYGLASASTPFSPALGSAPDGWEIALELTPSGAVLFNPGAIALDGSGNVFTTNAGGYSVSELTAASGYAVGLNFNNTNTGMPGAAFSEPWSIALDGAGNVFVGNFAGGGGASSVSELTAASSYATGLNFNNSNTGSPGAAFNSASFVPGSLALDASGNVLVANCGVGCYGSSGSGANGSVSELTAANGYATGLNFAPMGAAFAEPLSIALDGLGNVLVGNGNGGVSELAAPTYTSGSDFSPAGAAFSSAYSLALDGSGNVFVANCGTVCGGGAGNGSVSELTAADSYGTGLNFAPAGASFADPFSIALDGAGNVFVANTGNTGNYPGPGSVSELTASSNYATGLNFAATGAAFTNTFSLALDASGNVFAANELGNSVSEILGVATPVITPVQSCLIYWSNHPGQNCVP
jgi:hypothetical protein